MSFINVRRGVMFSEDGIRFFGNLSGPFNLP
jgi:hypothetical protein